MGSELLNHLDGYLARGDQLSPRYSFTEISRLSRPLIKYDPDILWRRETKLLPFPLQKLRRKVKRFAELELRPIALELDKAEHLPAGQIHPKAQQALVKAAKAGLLTDVLPKPLGSSPPLQYLHSLAWQQSVRIEELARVCGGLMLLLSAHHLGVAPILLSGDVAAIRRFVLPAYGELKRGEPHLFAFAITEPAAGSDVEEGVGASQYRPGVIARKTRGGWLLNGRKCFISGGDVAKSIVVFAALEADGKRESMASWTPFLVKRDMPGFQIERTELKMGMRASGAAEISFTEVFVPDSHVIGGLRKGWAINRATLNLSRFPVASMAVGLAQGAIDATTEFVCKACIGGKPLISFQEIQLAVAQMNAETSSIRGMVWKNAKAMVPKQAEASMCKFHATDRAVKVCEMAMDILGNHSMLHEHGIEKSFRDVRLTQIFEGTNQINRLAVIEDMQEELLAKINHSMG